LAQRASFIDFAFLHVAMMMMVRALGRHSLMHELIGMIPQLITTSVLVRWWCFVLVRSESLVCSLLDNAHVILHNTEYQHLLHVRPFARKPSRQPEALKVGISSST
jgi:hypothetical protein